MWIMGLGSMFETFQPCLLLCMGSVKNKDDAGTYFKGKYRVEGVTMKWVRVRMWIGCRVREGLRLQCAEQPPNLLG